MPGDLASALESGGSNLMASVFSSTPRYHQLGLFPMKGREAGCRSFSPSPDCTSDECGKLKTILQGEWGLEAMHLELRLSNWTGKVPS